MATKKDNTAPQNAIKRKERPLTPKQELFCRKYVEIGYASEAYRVAYDCTGMKQASVWSLACRLLNNVKVRSRIAEIEAEYAEASKIDRARVMDVLYDIVKCDPADIYEVDEETGKLKVKSPRQLPRRLRNALKKIKNKRGEVTYEFNGKVDAARLLASMNGWEAPKEVNTHIMTDGARKIIDFNIPDDEDEE